ncbi:biotin-dependent carboxyltransferase family protein [Paenibacillus sp. TRM 82003]|nr:biotin-dependent carboxyltransferase family protein [Paenibacillus sp. TRM 82003]
MTIRVIKAGMRDTVQDAGRTGWQRYGVSPGGAMDETSYRTANVLVGNPDGAAAIELAFTGGVYEWTESAVIAVCGANASPEADGEPLPMWRPVRLRAGTKLRFGTAAVGRYAYLAVAGGFGTPAYLGSRSCTPGGLLPGLAGRPLAAGDELPIGGTPGEAHRPVPNFRGPIDAASWYVGDEWRYHTESRSRVRVIRAMRGKEWPLFSEKARTLAASADWECVVRPESDRMGYRLESTPLTWSRAGELPSEAVTMGTVQVPADGQPIVLMADRQTTGGYPRLLQVIAADLPALAQARPGERLRFQIVDREEAMQALLERERRFAWLRHRLQWR